MPDFSANDRRRLDALAEREGRFLGGRQGGSLPLPMEYCLSNPAAIMKNKRLECVVLDDILKSALFNLHCVENSISFWQSKSEGTHHRKIYHLTFERGPKAFAEIACQALWNIKAPYKFLLDSCHAMDRLMDYRMKVLVNIQRCIAAFLTKMFTEVAAHSDDLAENSPNSLHTLFTVVNSLFQKLGPELKKVLGKDPGEFGMVQLVGVRCADWTIDPSLGAISLIYQNIRKLDSAISSELFLHGRPRSISMYWLPYTCGTIAFVGCSVWLIRNSSLEGTKHILTGIWDTHLKKPVISIRDELIDTSSGNDRLEKRRNEVLMMQDSLTRSLMMFFKNSSGVIPSGLSEQELLEHVFRSQENKLAGDLSHFNFKNTWTLATDPDLYRAVLIKIDKNALGFQQELLGVSQHMTKFGLSFAILQALPALGGLVLMFRLANAYGRGGALTRKAETSLLIATAEIEMKAFEKHFENGRHDDAASHFGMMVCKLNSLFCLIEPHARKLGELQWIKNDLIDLARQETSPEERGSILDRVKFTYQSTKVV